MLEDVTRATFEPHLNTTFRMPFDDGEALDLVLVEATDKTPKGFDGEQFSLIFKGPADPYLPQQTYVLEHADLGTIYLFLVPVEQTKDGFFYESFFNRGVREEE